MGVYELLPNEPAWYALFVRTGHEESLRVALRTLFPDVRTLIPAREMQEYTQGAFKPIKRLLLPGYVFFHTTLTPALCAAIQSLSHVIRICGPGRSPKPIEESEMQLLLKLVRSGDLIRMSEIRKVGDKVVVESGPLVGLEGIIQGIDPRKRRVRIRLSVDGVIRTIDLPATFFADPSQCVEPQLMEAATVPR